jgi:chromosome segregation ATPase
MRTLLAVVAALTIFAGSGLADDPQQPASKQDRADQSRQAEIARLQQEIRSLQVAAKQLEDLSSRTAAEVSASQQALQAQQAKVRQMSDQLEDAKRTARESNNALKAKITAAETVATERTLVQQQIAKAASRLAELAKQPPAADRPGHDRRAEARRDPAAAGPD